MAKVVRENDDQKYPLDAEFKEDEDKQYVDS